MCVCVSVYLEQCIVQTGKRHRHTYTLLPLAFSGSLLTSMKRVGLFYFFFSGYQVFHLYEGTLCFFHVSWAMCCRCNKVWGMHMAPNSVSPPPSRLWTIERSGGAWFWLTRTWTTHTLAFRSFAVVPNVLHFSKCKDKYQRGGFLRGDFKTLKFPRCSHGGTPNRSAQPNSRFKIIYL